MKTETEVETVVELGSEAEWEGETEANSEAGGEASVDTEQHHDIKAVSRNKLSKEFYTNILNVVTNSK